MNSRNIAVCLVGVSSLILCACDGGSRAIVRVDAGDPSTVVAGHIVPQPIGLRPLTGVSCPFLTPFTTNFDLVINLAGSRDLFLDQVTLRLSDGSSVGGSPVLMSSSDLLARFPSTRVRAGITSRFAFAPRFDCGRFVPRSLHADVILRDGAGMTQTTQLVVPIG
jgi:hypothetical protein